MKIGFTISDFGGKKPGELLSLARSFGVGFVEFNPTVFGDINAVCANMDGIVAGFHLPLVCEHGYDLSCLSAKDKIDDLIDSVNHYKNDLNLLYCVAHPPENESEWEREEDGLEYLIENLQRLEVPIIIENVETWSEGEIDRLYGLVQPVLGKKFLGFCYDPAHAFLRGEDILERFQNIAHKVICIHLSDCSNGKDAHLPLGQGDLPVREFLRLVAQTHFDGIINLEVAPKSLAESRALVESYLQVLSFFSKTKYWKTVMRLLTKSGKLKSLNASSQ